MRWRYLLLGVSFVVILGIFQPGLVLAEEDTWLTHETEHFVIEYREGYHDDAEWIGDKIEIAHAELSEVLPYDNELSFGSSDGLVDNPVHVRVYPGDEWSGSDWMLYWHDTTPVRIHVQAPSDSPVGTEWYEHGLAHETMNIYMTDDAYLHADYPFWRRNPSWFHQGLSEYFVYQTETVQSQFPPWGVNNWKENIRDGSVAFDELAADRYHGGHVISLYMVDEYGDEAVWDIVRSDEEYFVDAVEESLDVTYMEFIANWYRWAEENIGGDYAEYYVMFEDEADLSDRIKDLEEERDDLQRQVADLERLLEETDEELASDLQEVTEQRDDLQTRVDELEDDRVQLASDLEEIALLVDDADDVVDAVQTIVEERDEFETRVADLEGEQNDLHQELNATEQRLAELTSSLEILTAELDRMSDERDALEEELTTLREQDHNESNTEAEATPGFGLSLTVLALLVALAAVHRLRRV